MLRLWLCGRLAAELDGHPLRMPTSERARALIAWLALHPGPQPRSLAARELWPDAPADSARANLRTAVWAVNQAWEQATSSLISTRTTVALADGPMWVDVDDDDATGELLPGVDDEWVDAIRAACHDLRVRRLTRLAADAERDGDAAAAVRCSQRVCELIPLDEGAHRALLRRLVAADERAVAVATARAFAERLYTELGIRPSPATRAAQSEVAESPVTPPRPALFGRSAEVAQLTARWRAAASGRGQVVVISGEAGIGKTSLLTELSHRVARGGGRAAVGAGLDVAGETPFAVWLEIAQALVADMRPVPKGALWPVELSRLSPQLGAQLGHPGDPPVATAPELERLRVFESVLRLVEWSCAERPTLVAIDDAHRADRASLRLTAHIGRRLTRLPVLLVLVRRDGPRRPELDSLLADLTSRSVPVTELGVAPISDTEVAALACSLHRMDDRRVRDIVAAAEGNPLLAVETTRAIAAGSTGPPPNLRAGVRVTISRLSPETARLVSLLAVAGRPLHRDELSRLGLLSLRDAEDEAAAEGLLVRVDGRLGFRHELLRAAVYADVQHAAELHEQVAAALDPHDHAEVAHHLTAAGRVEQAAAAWVDAAAHARSVGAVREAVDFLLRATDLTPDDGRIWLELAEARAWSGQRTEMDEAWQHALNLLPEADLAAAWCRRGRQFRTVVCHPAASLQAYRAAAARLGPDAPAELQARVLIGLAWGDAVAGDGNRFEQLLTDAELLRPAMDADARTDVVEIRMQGLIRRGRFTEAVDVARAAEPAASGSGFTDRGYVVWINAACAMICHGDFPAALELADRAVELTRGAGILAVGCLAARSLILARMGRHEEAAESVREQQECADRLDAPRAVATAAHDRGVVALAAGRYAEAAEQIGHALAHDADISRVSAGLLRAEALARLETVEAAKAQLRAALLEPVGTADQPWALVPRIAWVQALIALADGQPALAAGRLEESAAAWRRVTPTARNSAADGYLASMVDLGRPPIVGLVEPEQELFRIAELLLQTHLLLPTRSEPLVR